MHAKYTPDISFSGDEPIAIIGIGCRFPGGSHDPETFWNFLCDGKDAIVEIPPERWNIQQFYDPDPNKPGKMYVRQGGFLRQRVDQFDAQFFGITPREADCMDPQQRLLLETSWEALEDAGIPPDNLAGSATGVFVGAFTLDHKLTQMGRMNRELIGPHTALGSTMTILSNRISYVLDLRGPSVSLDTACSSSLVALHLACQALRRGECDLALAGGVNVMMRPEYPMAMCKGGFLAPDGRSKSFDARANGYGRGEGAGTVVLKPLTAALRDKDSIYAVIRGTGANQDGRTVGITVPNAEAQAGLARRVCREAGIKPADIRYFEAHGTGTPVGDPLEAKALGQVIGQDRSPEDACWLGSVKASIGHLEAAAGIAGVIKASLCLSHRQVPPQANLETPNPNIPFAELGLRLPRKLESMPDVELLCAGINSFGYGGTNAHAILQAPPRKSAATTDATDHEFSAVLPLSARSEPALRALAQAYLDRFDGSEPPRLEDLAYSASCRRSHHPHRLAVTGATWAEWREQLQAYVERGNGEWLAAGKTSAEAAAGPVFVYTGMGPQWWAMGRELYLAEPAFREAANRCDALFQALSGWSILAELLAEESVSRIGETDVAQPAIFVVQAGLTALWRSLGIVPAAIVGHSVGEVAAAYAAGVLSLEDAVKVSYHRSRIQKKAAGFGRMLAVGLGQTECEALLKKFGGETSIAAINGPESITLAGAAEPLEAIADLLGLSSVFHRFLQVEVAYHSPFMEPLKPEVIDSLADLEPRLPEIPLYSTVTGRRVETKSYDADYWCRNIREPVYFAAAMKSLLADGYRAFLEVGPHPVLSTAIRECCSEAGVAAQNFASLRRGKPERRTLRLALAGLYSAGCPIDWAAQQKEDAAYLKLPLYPWQRETFWNESEESQEDRAGRPEHPLLGWRRDEPEPCWQTLVNRQYLPWLDDHRVDGLVVLPGAGYIEAGLAARQALFGDGPAELCNLSFNQALVVQGDKEPTLCLRLDPETGDYGLFSRPRGQRLAWQRHASGTVRALEASEPPVSLAEIAERCGDTLDTGELYARLDRRGLHYGPAFQGMRQLWRRSGEVLAQVEMHQDLLAEHEQYRLHPTLLDACFQSLIAILDGDDDRFYMPVAIERIRYYERPKSSFWCHGRLTRQDSQGIEGELRLLDETGRVLAEVLGLRCRALSSNRETDSDFQARCAYRYSWLAGETPSAAPRTEPWLVLADRGGQGEALAEQLASSGASPVLLATRGDRFEASGFNRYSVNPDDPAALRSLLELAREAGCGGIAYLSGLDAGTAKDDPAGTAETIRALSFLQQLDEVFGARPPRLYIATRGAQPVGPGDLREGLAQSPLVGLARVALNEYPGIRCTLVDLDPHPETAQMALLSRELLAGDGEDAVAFRRGERLVQRLERLPAPTEAPRPVPTDARAVPAFRLAQGADPAFKAIDLPESPPGTATVAVRHVNLSGFDGAATEECGGAGYFATGTVTAAGTGISGLREGDLVLVRMEGPLVSHRVANRADIFPLPAPEYLTSAEAAALATGVLPVYYALRHVVRVQPGDSLLIDADAPGLAPAALQVCRWLGALPIPYSRGAAGLGLSPETPCLDAAAGDFAGQVRQRTAGAGARALLTASGAPIETLTAALAPCGHIVRIGEPGAEDGGCGNLARVCIHPAALAKSAPRLFGRLLAELGERAALAELPPAQAVAVGPQEFLDSLSGSSALVRRPAGILDLTDPERIPIQPEPVEKPLFDPDGSYLITGGFGGFGLELAHWMAARGARHLVLVGRRGAQGDETKAALRALETAGVKVFAAAADIADERQLARLLAQVAAYSRPLRGIFHAAAVLDDAPIAELDGPRLARVMRPKALGAWHLHRLTQKLPLDYFVLFSSVSALIGNARQANYVAANTFLDALAWHRRDLGLPAQSVNWGAIATGMATESEEVRKHLELMGISALGAAQALDAWARLLAGGETQYGLMDVDWARWAEFEPTGGRSPRFAALVAAGGGGQAGEQSGLARELEALSDAERAAEVSRRLVARIAATLRLPEDRVDPQQSLTQMGVDSLMAAELQTAIHQAFGVRLSTLELMRGQSLAQLSGLLLEKTGLAAGGGAASTADEASLVDRLSGDDIDILLNQLLTEEN